MRRNGRLQREIAAKAASIVVRRIETFGSEVFSDRELLELSLQLCAPTAEVEVLACRLVELFGSVSRAISAPSEQLAELGLGLTIEGIARLKLLMCVGQRYGQDRLSPEQPILSSTWEFLDYCNRMMAFEGREQFRVVFLDKKNRLILSEVVSRGTVDFVPVQVREILRRAIILHSKNMILVHNHPSGDPAPSSADVTVTLQLIAACRPFDITVYDHLIIGRGGHKSLRDMKLI